MITVCVWMRTSTVHFELISTPQEKCSSRIFLSLFYPNPLFLSLILRSTALMYQERFSRHSWTQNVQTPLSVWVFQGIFKWVCIAYWARHFWDLQNLNQDWRGIKVGKECDRPLRWWWLCPRNVNRRWRRCWVLDVWRREWCWRPWVL